VQDEGHKTHVWVISGAADIGKRRPVLLGALAAIGAAMLI
jgi:hypothetical protein